MRSMREAIRRIAWSGMSLPAMAVVDAARAEPGGYTADVEVVHRVTRARTGEILEAVPLRPIWQGADGRGLYAPPERGQYVVVEWVEGDRSCPWISGAAPVDYAPAAAAQPGELVLVDGRGAELSVRGRWRLATAVESLRPILEALIDAIVGMGTTLGPAAPHVHQLDPGTIAALQAVRRRIEGLLDS